MNVMPTTGQSQLDESSSPIGKAERGTLVDQLAGGDFSPYRFFTADRWAEFRADTPLTLSEEELRRLRSLNDPIDMDEVTKIYLSLSRLLSSHVEASQALFEQRKNFLNVTGAVKTPFILGIAGSVAVGKSTTARILKELLARWPSSPKVDLVTTDGFLLPNEELRKRGIMERKGFPESYDVGAILRFLTSIKAGELNVQAPLYSHLVYDVLPNETKTVEHPDILIFEGINVLQVRDLPEDGRTVPFVSDFFDFSIYIDAEEQVIHDWYVSRFMRLRDTAFQDPQSFFHRYAQLSADAAKAVAEGLWTNINLKNLRENIVPTRPRADLIMRKGDNHLVESVLLRKL
ncbi:MAG: type I pantothenate kinase [Ahrensia sp.]